MNDLNKIIISWAIILFPAFSMAEETINTSNYGSQVENSTSNVSETGAIYYPGWSKCFNESTWRYECTDKDNNIRLPRIKNATPDKFKKLDSLNLKEIEENFKENKDNFKKQVKKMKSDIMDQVKYLKEQSQAKKQELKIKYRELFAKKLAWKLDSLTDDKIKAIIAKIDVAIKKYSNNKRLTPEKKEKFIAQLNAIKDLLQEKLDELIWK